MNMTLDDILVELVDDLGYEQDRAIFSAKFQQACLNHTLVSLLEATPDDERPAVVERLNQLDPADPEEWFADLTAIFPEEQFRDALTAALIEDMNGLLEAAEPELSDESRARLDDYVSQFSGAFA